MFAVLAMMIPATLPSADARGLISCYPQMLNPIYVDTSVGVDKGGCWGTSQTSAFKTVQAAVDYANTWGSSMYASPVPGSIWETFEGVDIYVDDSRSSAVEKVGSVTGMPIRISPIGTTIVSTNYVLFGRDITVQDFVFDGGSVRLGAQSFEGIEILNNTFQNKAEVKLYGVGRYSSYSMKPSYQHTVDVEGNVFDDSVILVDGLLNSMAFVKSNEFMGGAGTMSHYVMSTDLMSSTFNLSGNTFVDKPALSAKASNGFVIQGNTVSGGSASDVAFELDDSHVITFARNDVSEVAVALKVVGSSSTVTARLIYNNVIDLSYYSSASTATTGMYFENVDMTYIKDTFKENDISGVGYGIRVVDSVVDNFIGNTFVDIKNDAIEVKASTVNTIKDNKFDNAGKGVHVTDYSDVDEIIYNDFENTSGVGLVIEAQYGDYDVWASGEVGDDAKMAHEIFTKLEWNDFTNVDTGIGLAGVRIGDVKNGNYVATENGLDAYNSILGNFSGMIMHGVGSAASSGSALNLYASVIGTLLGNDIESFVYGVKLSNGSSLDLVDQNLFVDLVKAIYVKDSLLGTVQNSIFVEMGDAIYADSATSAFSVIYSTFYYYGDSAITLANALTGSGLEIANNVFSNSSVAVSDIEIYDVTDIAVLDYNLYDNATVSAGVSLHEDSTGTSYTVEDLRAIGLEEHGHVDAGSALVDPSAGDFALTLGSYAMNSGDAAYVLGQDYNGDARPVCAVPDMGALENQDARDSDGDGLCLEQETAWGTSDSSADSDGDDLSDYEEIFTYGTDALVGDTDGDGVSDGDEVLVYGTDPLDASDYPNDTDGDGMDDDWEIANGLIVGADDSAGDPDADGLTNLEEYVLGTDPNSADTDSDGMPDLWESENGLDPTVSSASEDADVDGLSDYGEYLAGTDPNDDDSDGDSYSDGVEVTAGSDPLDASSDPTTVLDSDSDGFTDLVETAAGTDPYDSGDYPLDTDGDGTLDYLDPDDDDDGYLDGDDAFPYDETEWLDTDLDGTGDNADLDDDADGYDDIDDAFPLDGSEWLDTDLDGTGDNADLDDDADGYDDVDDAFPLDATEWLDTDLDGTGDNADLDDDGDGYDDVDDAFSLDGSEWLDTDLDGTGDNADLDDDADGIDDVDDAFPLDATEWLDTDGDGTGNNADLDDDDDGFDDAIEIAAGTNPLNAISFPLDTDGDGDLDYIDTDDDDDGYDDTVDAFPYDSTEWEDFDSDGIGDNADPDDDDDGFPDRMDAFPLDATEWADFDGDGTGDNADTDDDDDGYDDSVDAFPYDSTEWEDTDGDGVGNNADTDDDGDGMDDDWETTYSLDPLVDDAADDLDGDTYSNLEEYLAGTDPSDASETPTDSDADGMDDDWETTYGLSVGTDDSADDLDSDGHTNYEEYVAGSDPSVTASVPGDVDGDGMDDSWEASYGLSLWTDDSGDDIDGDGLTNLEEYTAGTDPTDSDSDGDGYNDYEEVVTYSTDPNDASDYPTDTDLDGMDDDWETTYGLSVGTDDSADDLDGDSLTNLEEYLAGTDPSDTDTDDDGISDYTEIDSYGTDPTNPDTDGDYFSDGYELTEGTDLLDDTDHPTLDISFAAYMGINGSGDASAWNSSDYYSYYETYDVEFDSGDELWIQTQFYQNGVFGVVWDETAYVGDVTIEWCGSHYTTSDPTANTCSEIVSYSASADPDAEATLTEDSSQIEVWSYISPYQTYEDWAWYRTSEYFSYAYDSFKVTLN